MRLFRLGIAFAVLVSIVGRAEGRVCGTRYLKQHREQFVLPAFKPVASQQETEVIEVGTQLDFLVSGDARLRSATCQFLGEHCYIFIEDSQWDTNGGSVYQRDVDVLGKLFDHSTPTDPERGFYELEVEAFGTPPDVDGDERIFILIVDIADPVLIGFFDPRVATWPDPLLRRDTIYLDAQAVISRQYLARGTLAHEFQHLIHWKHDEDEEIWVDEGLSGYAEELTGFPETDPQMVPRFLAQPDLDLTAWPFDTGSAIPHYGATFLFTSFLAERYGVELIRQIVSEPRNGMFGIDEAFKKEGQVQNFSGAWAQWIVANYASDDDLHGYRALKGRRAVTFPSPELPFEGIGGVVNREWGAVNITFRSPGNIAVEFAGEEVGRYSVRGYAMREETGEVVEMELDEGNRGRIEVPGVDSLVVIVGRTSRQGSDFELSAEEYEITAVGQGADRLPREVSLGSVYPNPFNGYALIPFSLPTAAELELSVYDALGQRIRVLRQGMHAPGQFQVRWDGLDDAGNAVGSGTYITALQVGERRLVRRMSLVK